ncbi:MAG: DUF1573 domain-containing protein [Candidatus Hydrogenedentes bacterium]|nr:DUF1573 domain-containing protein [Candidatus Hydrogenedentota bacterium]
MNVIRMILLVLFFGLSAAAAPKVRVEPESLDFGTLQAGTKSEKSVTIHNDGDAPLIVLRAKGTCTCATIEPPEGEDGSIQPGASAQAPVRFDATDRTGKQSAVVAVTTNDPGRPAVTINVTAVVETLAVLRPPNGLLWQQAPRGETIRRTVVIIPGDAAQDIELVDIASDNKLLTPTAAKVTRNGHHAIDVKCALAKDTPLGDFAATVTARVRVAGQETTIAIPARGLVVGDVIVMPLELHSPHKTVKRGEAIGEILVRASRGGEAPAIAALQTAGPVTAELEPVRGQDQHRVVVSVMKDAPSGPNSATVYIMTSGNDQPVAEVPVFFNVARGVLIAPERVALESGHATQRIELRNDAGAPMKILGLQFDTGTLHAKVLVDSQQGADQPASIEVSILNPASISLSGTLLTVETDVPGDESIVIPVLIRP